MSRSTTSMGPPQLAQGHSGHSGGAATLAIRCSVERRGERRGIAAAARRGCGWRASRSGGCGRSPGQHVEQEAAQKLIAREVIRCCRLLRRRVTPAKGDLAIRQGDQAVVGDSNAVGIAAEILQHVLGSAEGWFGIDDPILRKSGRSQAAKNLGWVSECNLRPGAVVGDRRQTSGRRRTCRGTLGSVHGTGRKKRGWDRIQRG